MERGPRERKEGAQAQAVMETGGRADGDDGHAGGNPTGNGSGEGGKEGIMRECCIDRNGRTQTTDMRAGGRAGGRADADNTDLGQLSVANDRKVESLREFEVSKHGA